MAVSVFLRMLFRESRNERIGFWRLDQILAENPFVRQSFAQLEGKLQPLILLLTFFAMKVYLPSHIYTKNAHVKYFQRLNVPSPCAQNDTVIVPDRLVFQVRRAQRFSIPKITETGRVISLHNWRHVTMMLNITYSCTQGPLIIICYCNTLWVQCVSKILLCIFCCLLNTP